MKTCSAYSQARMEREGVPMKPGVREILDFLKARNIPHRFGHLHRSGTYFAPHGANRPRFPTSPPSLPAIRVVHSKPDPEIYQLACRALGTDPAQTIAVEDSPQWNSFRFSGRNEGYYGS